MSGYRLSCELKTTTDEKKKQTTTATTTLERVIVPEVTKGKSERLADREAEATTSTVYVATDEAETLEDFAASVSFADELARAMGLRLIGTDDGVVRWQ